MSELRTDAERLGRIEAALPHLATREAVAEITATLPHLATKAELADLRSDLGRTEIRLIKWLVGSAVIAFAALSAQLWGAVQLLIRLHS